MWKMLIMWHWIWCLNKHKDVPENALTSRSLPPINLAPNSIRDNVESDFVIDFCYFSKRYRYCIFMINGQLNKQAQRTRLIWEFPVFSRFLVAWLFMTSRVLTLFKFHQLSIYGKQ